MTNPNQHTDLQAFFEPSSLTSLGLIGSSICACLRYHDTALPKRGAAAWLGKLPILKSLPAFDKKPVPMDVDLACLAFDASFGVLEKIWYGNLRSGDEVIRHDGDALVGARNFEENLINQEEIRVRIDALNPQIHQLVFVLSSHHDQPLHLAKKGAVFLMDNEQHIAHSVDLATLNGVQSLILWTLTRTGNDWQLSAPMHTLPATRHDKHIDNIALAVQDYLRKQTQAWAMPTSQ